MPSTPPPRGSFYPPNDAATYRDLLMFEERLKTNAANLQLRKHRYQLFLLQLFIVIAFLLSEVLLQTTFLSLPYRWLMRKVLPDIEPPPLHPYFASGLLFVGVTTLVLFFASGMYSEKIAYANQYVPHANRALRSFNMYLNVRKPPLLSKIPFNPIPFLFPRPQVQAHTSVPSSPTVPRTASIPISPIPPATNPRGELIFSSKVNPSFRESYERYRAAFERKREERMRENMAQTFWGRIWLKMIPKKSVPPLTTGSSSPGSGLAASPSLRAVRGRGSTPSGTPTSSRRSSPGPTRPRTHSGTPRAGVDRGGSGSLVM